MSAFNQDCAVPIKDEINVESDNYPVSFPHREACDICLKPFDAEPKIRCAECRNTTLICLQCFALGLETQTHRCDHDYHIDCRHIPSDSETDWSLQDDYDLLQRVLEYGYGNYVALNKGFMHRTVDEIRIRIDELLGLDKAPLRACLQIGPKVVMPFNAEVARHEPPRFLYRSAQYKQLAGYCAPRGDFETEFANNAEEMLKTLDVDSDSDSEEDEDSDGLSEELTCALVQCYNEKLRERVLRKKCVKNYGLISRRPGFMLSHIANSKLSVFTQFMDSDNYDALIEGLSMESALKHRMRRYVKYRSLGITRVRACQFYDKLETVRTQESRNLQKTLQMISNSRLNVHVSKKASRLDVSQYSGYETLSLKEREFCSNTRILPEKYVQFKNALRDVSAQDGGVRLMAARAMLKIDVNKTRQLFNFLRDEGIINAI